MSGVAVEAVATESVKQHNHDNIIINITLLFFCLNVIDISKKPMFSNFTVFSGLLTPALSFQFARPNRAIETCKMQSGTQTGPKTVVEPSDVKKRLDSVFGSYTSFSELIVKPGFNSSSIYGVVPIPMSPVINGTPAPFQSTQGYHPVSTNTHSSTTSTHCTDKPSSSTNGSGQLLATTRVPTKDVLESMQRLVDNEPLSTLDCSRNRNCIVSQDSPASTSATFNGDLHKDSKKRALSSSPEQPVEKKRKKKYDEPHNKPMKEPLVPEKTLDNNKLDASQLERDLFGDFSDEDESSELCNSKLNPSPSKKKLEYIKNEPDEVVTTHSSVLNCQKDEAKASPRIILKLPRPSSTSSLSTVDGHSKNKNKHKKHKSDKHKPESRESKHKFEHEREVSPDPVTTETEDNSRLDDKSKTVPITKEEPIDGSKDIGSRYQLADVEQILEQFGRVSPLISPLHRISPPTELLEDENLEPNPYNAARITKCHLNLFNLSPKRCQKLTSKWHKLMGLEPLLSPALMPKETVVDVRAHKSEDKRRSKPEKDIPVKENCPENERLVKEQTKFNESENCPNQKSVDNSDASRNKVSTNLKPGICTKNDREKEKEVKEEKIKPKIRPSEKAQEVSTKPAETKVKNAVQDNMVKPKAEPERESEKGKQRLAADNLLPVKLEVTHKMEEREGRRPSKSKKSAASNSSNKANLHEDVMERTKPTSKAILEKVESVKETVGYYQNLARKIKHNGDREQDRIKKVMFYLESVVYFIMSASVQKPTESGDIETNIVNEVTNFLKSTTSNFVDSKSEMPHISHFRGRVKTIRGFIQSCLTYQLYQIRSLQAQNNYKILRQYEQDPNSAHQQVVKKHPSGGESTGGNSTMTPSPAASTPSSNRSINSKEMITVPMDLYSLSFYQNKILNHLMWAHHFWKDTLMQMPLINRDFIAHLDKTCGILKMDSDLRDIAIWLLTSVRWMNREYGELKNPS